MALIECKECKREVSTDAVKCPQCGAVLKLDDDQKAHLIGGTLVVAIVLFIWLFLSGSGDEPAEASPSPSAQIEQDSGPPAEWLALDRSEEMQAERLSFIEQLHDAGIVHKIEKPSRYPRIYTGPGWDALVVDDKRQFANSVLTYFYAEDPEATAVVLRDRHNGDDIGRYTYRFGLELYGR